MAAEIIHDDNVTFPQFWNEHLVHISLEGEPVDRPVENHWRYHARQAQACNEGRRLPMAVRDGGPQPLATGRTPAHARRVGRRPCLVNEDGLGRIEANLAVAPLFPLLQDVRPLLLSGIYGLFLSVIFRRWKKRDNAETLKVCPSAASAAFSSSERVVGLGRYQCEDALSLPFDRPRTSIAALWLRRHLTCPSSLRHPPDRARHAHSKVRRSLSTRHAARDGSDHTLAQINRKS